MLKLTSNAQVRLVKTEENCCKKLFEVVNIISCWRYLSEQQLEKPDGRMCSVNSEVQRAGVKTVSYISTFTKTGDDDNYYYFRTINK